MVLLQHVLHAFDFSGFVSGQVSLGKRVGLPFAKFLSAKRYIGSQSNSVTGLLYHKWKQKS